MPVASKKSNSKILSKLSSRSQANKPAELSMKYLRFFSSPIKHLLCYLQNLFRSSPGWPRSPILFLKEWNTLLVPLAHAWLSVSSLQCIGGVRSLLENFRLSVSIFRNSFSLRYANLSSVAHRDCDPSSCRVLLPFLPIGGDAEPERPGNSGGSAAKQTMVNPHSSPRFMCAFSPFPRVLELDARRGPTQGRCIIVGYYRLPRLGRVYEESGSRE